MAPGARSHLKIKARPAPGIADSPHSQLRAAGAGGGGGEEGGGGGSRGEVGARGGAVVGGVPLGPVRAHEGHQTYGMCR